MSSRSCSWAALYWAARWRDLLAEGATLRSKSPIARLTLIKWADRWTWSLVYPSLPFTASPSLSKPRGPRTPHRPPQSPSRSGPTSSSSSDRQWRLEAGWTPAPRCPTAGSRRSRLTSTPWELEHIAFSGLDFERNRRQLSSPASSLRYLEKWVSSKENTMSGAFITLVMKLLSRAEMRRSLLDFLLYRSTVLAKLMFPASGCEQRNSADCLNAT